MPKKSKSNKQGKHTSDGRSNGGAVRDAYAAYVAQEIVGYRFYGFPGAQLSEAERVHGSGRSWTQGRIGERFFMSVLAREGILDQCVSFWSLKRDAYHDIDCVLLFDDEIVLVDVKSLQDGKSEEDTRKQLKGKVRSMKDAKKHIRKKLGKRGAKIPIRCYIVFVPTPDANLRKIEYDQGSVHVTWYKKFCKKMKQVERNPEGVNETTETCLARITQKYPDHSYGSHGTAEWDNDRWQESYKHLLNAWAKEER